MISETGDQILIYNGEAYNYQQLKKELLSNGITFHTESDTEVLLKYYCHYGIDNLLSNLNGMFAFALLDLRLNNIYLARDRFGEKPLYYNSSATNFSFASEIKGISCPDVTKSINLNSIEFYLSELTTPSPETIFNEIHQLERSNLLTYNLTSHSFTLQEYWKPPQVKIPYTLSKLETLETTENLLKSSVLSRTQSSVPFACFLSGGVDSGLVVSMLSEFGQQKVNTFTIGYKNSRQDESELAKAIAEKYNTNHHEIFLESDILSNMHEIVEKLDEPFADTGIIPTYQICKAFSKHYKMAISGDGGDEIFGGYYEFIHAWQADNLNKNYGSGFKASALTKLSKLSSRIGFSKNLGHAYDYLKSDGSGKLYRMKGISPTQKQKALQPQFYNATQHYTQNWLNALWKNSLQNTVTDTLFHASIPLRLNEYLFKLDRASMMNSLEVRTPFLDKPLADFVFTIPGEIKLEHGIKKYLLRKIAEKYIGNDILTRPKQGFGMPFGDWIRKDLKYLIREKLNRNRIQNQKILNPDFTEYYISQHMNGKADYSTQIWSWLILHDWMEINGYTIEF
jgi:asparagine synthase (glutamine-hydrolysing)